MVTRAASSRKRPKQARSRVTFETILDGAIRVFDQLDPDMVTTTRIAEAAGVSVGTLYQYFSNRQEIVDALQEREFERALSLVEKQLSEEIPSTGSADATGWGRERRLAFGIISGLLSLYRTSPGLHRYLAVDGLQGNPSAQVRAFDQKLVDLLWAFFDQTKLRVQRSNTRAAAFVLYHSVRASLLAAILEEPPGISDETLVFEVTDLVVAHLVGAEVAPRQ